MKCEDYFKAWILFWFTRVVNLNDQLKTAYLNWGMAKFPHLQDQILIHLFGSNPKFRSLYLNEVLWPAVVGDLDVFSDAICITNIYALFDVDFQSLEIFEEKISPETQEVVVKKISAAITDAMTVEPNASIEAVTVYQIFKPILDELTARAEKRPKITEMVGRLVNQF
jgi:hypothetical protein